LFVVVVVVVDDDNDQPSAVTSILAFAARLKGQMW
jgi:hypothetical protein